MNFYFVRSAFSFSSIVKLRRSFTMLLSCVCLPVCLLATNVTTDTLVKKVILTSKQVSLLRKDLKHLEVNYDRSAHMLSQSFKSPGYHTTLSTGVVHSTFSSLSYALNLLDADVDSLSQRAVIIIDTVLALQEKNRMSKFFGIWPWYLEEPIEKMSPPDLNWADFCGKKLLEIIIDHRAQLTTELAVKVDSAILFAASAIQNRNVGPSYTNIAVMGTFVTLVAGEYYKIPSLYNYGMQRLQRFYNYTEQEGGFTEFNSPTYNMVAVDELNRMRFYVKSAEALVLVNSLYSRLWREIAIHFHVPTQQWAGPHSRSYNNFLQQSTVEVLKNAFAKEKDKSFLLDDYRYSNKIPDSLKYYFTDSKQIRIVVDTFKRSQPASIGTTYIYPDYTLGSVNQSDMWNQRRNLIAYWGDESQVSVMYVRLMHDFYDFSSGVFRSIQRDNKVLAGISFITDGGDKHPSLDKVKNATIKARDIRLRFEFNGYGLSNFNLKKLGEFSDYTNISLNNMDISLIVPFAVFGNNNITWDYGSSKNAAWVDVVFYSGTTVDINLSQIEKAAAVMALTLSKKIENNLPELALKNVGSDLLISWGDMQLFSPLKPYKSK